MSCRTEPLVVDEVIGDVIDMFAPSSLKMSISYSTRKVSNGCDIKPSATTQSPSLRMSDPYSRNSLFTLVVVDPDAPSLSEPTMREGVHRKGDSVVHGTEVDNGYSQVRVQTRGAHGGGAHSHDASQLLQVSLCSGTWPGASRGAFYFNAQKESAHSYRTHKCQPNKDSKDLLQKMRLRRVHSSVLTLLTA
ncbi:hypothetical protein L7F22_057245 [Adiantum nelumboides]|nr:hypothetical protein [Adiantum nelumboides]